MGILNVTPDSFYDGGLFLNPDAAVRRGLVMEEEGADIIDVGGESTRPGADPVSVREEMERILPVIEGIRRHSDIPVSVDTSKSDVARAALDAGADMINDVSGLTFDPQMQKVISDEGACVVLMHMQGNPKTMQKKPEYSDLIEDISAFLNTSVRTALDAGIHEDKIIIDPGIGFGKKWKDNYIILDCLDIFQKLGFPILVGVSRKSFIGHLLNLPEQERLWGTAAAVTAAVLNGCHIVRVHDVREMRQVVQVADAVKTARETASVEHEKQENNLSKT